MKKIEKIKERMEMHKKIMIAIFINGIVVEIYSMVVMFIFQDLSALYSLIGAVIGVSLSYAIYCAKSYFGKREEVRMELEKHMWKYCPNCGRAIDWEDQDGKSD